MTVRSLSARSSRPIAAVVAQGCQALGAFGLQLLAVRLLGAGGLGQFSLCLGFMVLTAALISGVVGDSLVILDRRDRATRGGLQFWTLALTGLSFSVTVAALPLSGLLDGREALVMGFALVVFQLEELTRRLLMASLQSWRLVAVDAVAAVTGLGFIAVWAWLGPVSLIAFFWALLVGQLAGLAAGIALLPAVERSVVSMRGAGVRAVAAFGMWRGLQVAVPPLLLTAMRVVVIIAAGRIALGELELGRIYVAPALLAVQGLTSYLLSTYARDRTMALTVLLQRARRASLGMVVASVVVGGAILLIGPGVAHYVSGPGVSLDRLVLLGWISYVIAAASTMPFTALAAARGQAAKVLGCRVIDAVLSILVLSVALGLGLSHAWAAAILAAGIFLGGILVRQFALRPLLSTDGLSPGSSATTHAQR